MSWLLPYPEDFRLIDRAFEFIKYVNIKLKYGINAYLKSGKPGALYLSKTILLVDFNPKFHIPPTAVLRTSLSD